MSPPGVRPSTGLTRILRRAGFLGLPDPFRPPELPSPRRVVRQVGAVVDPRPVAEWLRGHREPAGKVPPLRPTPALAAKFLVDEWALQLESARSRARVPTTTLRRRFRHELTDALDLFEDRGWIRDPRSYHQDPPPLDDGEVALDRIGFGPGSFEHLRWSSDWEPWPDEPGRDRWVDYRRNRTAHAWLLRHRGPPRPWILCVNGYRTGDPATDLLSFRAGHLRRALGLNVAILVQPLHGPRAFGPSSGDRVVFGGAMNLVHALAQAAWDARRLLSWLRASQGARHVGIQGLSLGGFVTGLMAGLDDDLRCAVAGIPESDMVRGLRRSFEPLLPPYYEQWGLSWTPYERVSRVVSPLGLPPLVPQEGRYIFAGLVDRWVRPANIVTLWEHWERPSICWYQGGHLSALSERSVKRFVDGALRRHLGRRATD